MKYLKKYLAGDYGCPALLGLCFFGLILSFVLEWVL